jgi:hypothetical protein
VVHRRGIEKIAIRRSERHDSGASGAKVLAEKLADVTVLPDYQNISALYRFRISGLRSHLFLADDFWECSAPKPMVFEPELSALSLIEDGIRINYEASPKQLPQFFYWKRSVRRP